VVCANRVSLAWFSGDGWVNGGWRVPGVEMGGALGDVWSYEFGDYEIVYYGFWFLVCYVAIHLALQECMQVVRSNKVVRRMPESRPHRTALPQ